MLDVFDHNYVSSRSISIPKNYRNVVYCTAIRYGTESDWNFLANQYEKETDGNSKSELQYGMSCAREPWLINKYLNYQLDESKVRVQDTLRGLSHAFKHANSFELAWRFFRENWILLIQRFY
jgi:aminopeptidase N